MAHMTVGRPDEDDVPTDTPQRRVTLVAVQGVPVPQTSGAVVSGTVLEPGRRFDDRDNARAIVLKSGTRVEAAPSTYFNSSRDGRTIRLWQRTIPGVNRDSRRLAWWWAKRDVAEVLSQQELARRQEEEQLGKRTIPVVIDPTKEVHFVQPRRRRFIWQGLIVAVLIAAIVIAVLTVTGVLSVSLGPTYMTMELVAIIGIGALIIFAMTCLAIVQRVTTA